MIVTLNGHEIFLHSSGVALWREHGIAVVADLHLEKGSHFAKRGFFLPPYDSEETLARLAGVCAAEAVRQVVILGDCFHDAKGYARLSDAGRRAFARLLDLDAIWIKGNHDGDFVPEGLTAHDSYQRDGIVFRHESRADSAPGEISGHFHPKVRIAQNRTRLQRPCFVEDGFRLLLPAFGAYTGGLDVGSKAIRSLFGNPFRCHVPGENRVYSLGVWREGA